MGPSSNITLKEPPKFPYARNVIFIPSYIHFVNTY